MRAELIRLTLGGSEHVLRAYGTFYALAFVLSPLLAAWVASRRGLGGRRALIVYAGALASGILGARALDLFVAGGLYAEDPSRIWGLSFTGFSLYGGLVLATLAAIALARALRQPVWRLADSAVPGLVLGLVLMRVGCFLNGCCFGRITDLLVFPFILSYFTNATRNPFLDRTCFKVLRFGLAKSNGSPSQEVDS